jgi:hypothetical protein
VLKQVAQCDQSNYPEVLQRVYVVNAPFIFSTVWGVIKGFLDKRVQDKIRILGGSKAAQMKVLADDLPIHPFYYNNLA